MMSKEREASWAADEFSDVNLGDKRLDARLVTLCDRFSDSPESPINQACADWAETKAAYRFFRNESVEACRFGQAQRLTRYLMVMSIVAWRLFMITLIARAAPDTPCTDFLADDEWKVLFRRTHSSAPLPAEPPCAGDVVVWIARRGGFLARKGDGPPGTITLWRGWKRLTDLADGWNLATQGDTCG